MCMSDSLMLGMEFGPWSVQSLLCSCIAFGLGFIPYTSSYQINKLGRCFSEYCVSSLLIYLHTFQQINQSFECLSMIIIITNVLSVKLQMPNMQIVEFN